VTEIKPMPAETCGTDITRFNALKRGILSRAFCYTPSLRQSSLMGYWRVGPISEAATAQRFSVRRPSPNIGRRFGNCTQSPHNPQKVTKKRR
jgi:hypothetical protein